MTVSGGETSASFLFRFSRFQSQSFERKLSREKRGGELVVFLVSAVGDFRPLESSNLHEIDLVEIRKNYRVEISIIR